MAQINFLSVLVVLSVHILCVNSFCEDNEFECNDGTCIPDDKKCDDSNDCPDESDEINCDLSGAIDCEFGKYRCQDDACIDNVKICDGNFDCLDHSDESTCTHIDCGSEACPDDSRCISFPNGSQCVCISGYKYNSDLNACEDINECDMFGLCTHYCENTLGSYSCTCPHGFRHSDRTCYSELGSPYIIYSDQKSVNQIIWGTKTSLEIVGNLNRVIGIEYDHQDNIYWTSIQNGAESVVKYKKGHYQNIVLSSGLDTPEDIAIDFITQKIYLTDSGFRHIAVCSDSNGQLCISLVSTREGNKPLGIALWPEMGLMYWTEWGINSTISRASMDGSHSIDLVTANIYLPNGIALDIFNERFYWADAKMNIIASARMDGTDRRTIVSDTLQHPYGVAVVRDRLYWTDWGTRAIESCHKFTGLNHEVIVKGDRMYGIRAYEIEDKGYYQSENPCEEHKCSHMCLLAANQQSSCACPDNMSLAKDGKRCIQNATKQILFMGLRNIIFEMEHTSFGKHAVLQEYALPMYIDHMAYNSANGTVLIADNVLKEIAEYDLIRKELKVLISGSLGNVTGMAYDHLTQNLYWTDSERHVVEVYSLRMKQRAVAAFTGIDAPVGIALMPQDGKMFIVVRSPKKTKIVQIGLDGKSGATTLFEDIGGTGSAQILVELQTRKIYWVDTDGGKIESANLDSLHRHILRIRLIQPWAVAVINNDIFWTCVNSPYLHLTHKSNLVFEKKVQVEVTRPTTDFKLQLLSSHANTTIKHPCMNKNGGCSHICVALGNSSASCLCATGWVFKDAQNQTCIETSDCVYRCKSGECLTLDKRCNGRKDCHDGSDETLCNAAANETSVACAFDEFMCSDRLQCLRNDLRCNKVKDCRDGSDEKHCESFDNSTICHSHQHTCSNGRCVDLSVMCDGVDDCGDKSDETTCAKNVENPKPKCGMNMFQCTSGTCIAKSWECDGHVDCTDGSDEHGRCDPKDCPKDMYKCKHGQCIDERLVCDGHNDCGDNSEENSCSDNGTIVCNKYFDASGKPTKFQCPSEPMICLDWKAKCNGTAECPKGEDEIDCYKCSVYEFQCKVSLECIQIEFHCDGDKDCKDGTDELNCEPHNASTIAPIVKACDPDMFDCKDGTCIDDSKTCDGKKDCRNGEDEGKRCNTMCEKNNLCEHKCRPTPFGPKCTCPEGYKLNVDNKKCVDINECLEDANPCAQLCDNLPGSYRCSCYSGFMLLLDKSSCKSLESNYSLLFSTHNQIRSLTEFPMTLKVILSANDTKIASFDVDIGRNRLYYTTHDMNGVFEWNMSDGVVSGGLAVENPSKLAIDWITGNVYVISQTSSYLLKACNFEKKFCADIIKLLPPEEMRAIAVDPISRKIFYAAITSKGFNTPTTVICLAEMDGYKHVTLATIKVLITALEVDTKKKQLFFVDANSKSIQCVGYGENTDRLVRTIIRNENALIQPSAISIHENVAFIVNIGAKEGIRCRLYGDTVCEAFYWNLHNSEDIVVYSRTRQEIVGNDCYHKKCSGLCVLGPLSFGCMCADGGIVDEYYMCPTRPSLEISKSEVSNKSGADGSKSSTAMVAVICSILAIMIVLAGVVYYKRTMLRTIEFGSVTVKILK